MQMHAPYTKCVINQEDNIRQINVLYLTTQFQFMSILYLAYYNKQYYNIFINMKLYNAA